MHTIPRLLTYAVAACAITACFPVNTVPEPVAPSDPVAEYELEIPGNLEVRHVDFSATIYADGSGNLHDTSVGGRAFLKVHAVDRDSGEAVLLLYENVAERKQPVQVFRFRNAATTGSGDRR